MNSSISKLSVILATAVLQWNVAWASDRLFGRVVDYGAATETGIGGVTVEVFMGPERKLVGRGATDGNGQYDVAIQAPTGAKLSAAYSRMDYFKRPTLRSVTYINRQQPDIGLYQRGKQSAYYEQFAQNVRQAAADPVAAQLGFSAAASLSDPELRMVFKTGAAKLGERMNLAT